MLEVLSIELKVPRHLLIFCGGCTVSWLLCLDVGTCFCLGVQRSSQAVSFHHLPAAGGHLVGRNIRHLQEHAHVCRHHPPITHTRAALGNV